MKNNININFADAIFARIENERLRPIPAWRTTIWRSFVFAMWSSSIVFGAIAVAVALDRFGNWFYLLDAEPSSIHISFSYLWIGTFIGMMLAAFFSFRKTRFGYKDEARWILFSNLFFSMFLGAVFLWFGIPGKIDLFIADNFSKPTASVFNETIIWDDAKLGRFSGVIKEGKIHTSDGRIIEIVGKCSLSEGAFVRGVLKKPTEKSIDVNRISETGKNASASCKNVKIGK